ncbi:hypothetical protein K9M59_04135 [Candidatus Gracilibacteria bacterium]|nr:hypothetical protein [Candidatus Gracilibacteria bacterium]MCF7819511.1 hypothetical protein [Candidatus Gracilibacteria bacterium]
MKIKLFFFGKENEMTERERELLKRINFRCSTKVFALPQAGVRDPEKTKEKEGD